MFLANAKSGSGPFDFLFPLLTRREELPRYDRFDRLDVAIANRAYPQKYIRLQNKSCVGRIEIDGR